MQLEKKTKTHKIFKRNDGRYAVKTLKGLSVNGEDKVSVLLAEGLVTAPEPKAKEPEPVEEVAEEATEDAAVEEEAPAEEETPAEEPIEEKTEDEAPAEEEAAAEEPSEDEPKEEKKD